MEYQERVTWEAAVDAAEASTVLPKEIPDEAPLGSIYKDEVQNRKWMRVQVQRGTGRWAYRVQVSHAEIKAGNTKPSHEWWVIADRIFDPGAKHFVGMLEKEYNRLSMGEPRMWCLIEPKMAIVPTQYMEEEKPKERYEKSKEVFDVETGTLRKLP